VAHRKKWAVSARQAHLSLGLRIVPLEDTIALLKMAVLRRQRGLLTPVALELLSGIRFAPRP